MLKSSCQSKLFRPSLVSRWNSKNSLSLNSLMAPPKKFCAAYRPEALGAVRQLRVTAGFHNGILRTGIFEGDFYAEDHDHPCFGLARGV